MFNLYEHIKELGVQQGFRTMRDLCNAANVRESVMSNLNNGRAASITPKTAQKFADTLGVSVDMIYGRETKNPVTTSDGKQFAIDFSTLTKEQIEIIQEVMQMDAQSLSVARPVIESLLSSQQVRDGQ